MPLRSRLPHPAGPFLVPCHSSPVSGQASCPVAVPTLRVPTPGRVVRTAATGARLLARRTSNLPTETNPAPLPRPPARGNRVHRGPRRAGLSVAVMDGDTGKRKGPAHARGRALPKGNEDRLTDLGKQLPPRGTTNSRSSGGSAGNDGADASSRGTTIVLLALAAGAIAQWVRPLPSDTPRTVSVRLPGAPALAWPSTGEAAATVAGVGALGQVRGTQVVPAAGLAQALTAHVILSDHRLAPGDDGPLIPVSSDALAAYQAGLASRQSEIPVATGESLTELQALEGMLIDAGADMATVLADWDKGNVGALVTKMNAAAVVVPQLDPRHGPERRRPRDDQHVVEDLVRLGKPRKVAGLVQQIVSLVVTSVPIPPRLHRLQPQLRSGPGRIAVSNRVRTRAHRAATSSLLVQEHRRERGRRSWPRSWPPRRARPEHGRSRRRRRRTGEEHSPPTYRTPSSRLARRWARYKPPGVGRRRSPWRNRSPWPAGRSRQDVTARLHTPTGALGGSTWERCMPSWVPSRRRSSCVRPAPCRLPGCGGDSRAEPHHGASGRLQCWLMHARVTHRRGGRDMSDQQTDPAGQPSGTGCADYAGESAVVVSSATLRQARPSDAAISTRLHATAHARESSHTIIAKASNPARTGSPLPDRGPSAVPPLAPPTHHLGWDQRCPAWPIAPCSIGKDNEMTDWRRAARQLLALRPTASPSDVYPEHGDAHEYHPQVGDATQKSGRTSHLHELAHDDPDFDQGKADGAHRHDGACRRDPFMRGLMIDPEVAQRNGHQDQPHHKEPLVEHSLHHHLTT